MEFIWRQKYSSWDFTERTKLEFSPREDFHIVKPACFASDGVPYDRTCSGSRQNIMMLGKVNNDSTNAQHDFWRVPQSTYKQLWQNQNFLTHCKPYYMEGGWGRKSHAAFFREIQLECSASNWVPYGEAYSARPNYIYFHRLHDYHRTMYKLCSTIVGLRLSLCNIIILRRERL